MKNIFTLFILMCFAFIFASCQKMPGHAIAPVGGTTGTGTGTGGGTGVTTGTSYHTSTMYNTSGVRVFTKSGEVLDTAVIGRFGRSFFTGHGSGATYLKGYSGPYIAGSPFTIQLGNGTAAITDNGTYLSTKTTITGNDIRMTAKDSVIDIISDPNDVIMYNLNKDMAKYVPTYDILVPPGQAGNPFNGYLRNYLTDYFATQSGNTLLYPVMFGTAVIDTSSPGIIGTTSIGFIVNNKFSGIAGTHLKTTDTVVFQEFNIVLVK